MAKLAALAGGIRSRVSVQLDSDGYLCLDLLVVSTLHWFQAIHRGCSRVARSPAFPSLPSLSARRLLMDGRLCHRISLPPDPLDELRSLFLPMFLLFGKVPD